MNKSESIKNVAVALAKFQAEVTNPKNTANNPFYKSSYAPLQDVLNDARPLLSKHGLSIIQSPSGDGERISVNTLLLHESGEWIEFEPLVLKAEKVTPQGAGIAITYGRRYSLSAVLGIASEDDDDGNGLEKGQGKKKYPEPDLINNKLIGEIKTVWIANGHKTDTLNAQLNKLYKSNIEHLTLKEANEFLAKLKSKESA